LFSNKYFSYKPSPREIAEEEARHKYADANNKVKDNPKLTAKKVPSYLIEVDVTDQHVLQFCNNLKNQLRAHMTNARRVTEIGAVFQVLTAAAASAVGATAAGAAVGSETTETMAALAGASAVTPQLQSVFSLGARSDAYNQGLALVEMAEAKYYSAIAEAGTTAKGKLTPAGADLYTSSVAALKLVESAIASKIPSIADLQAAQGIRVNQIQLEPAQVRLTVSTQVPGPNDPGTSSDVIVVADGPITGVVSHDPTVAAVPSLTANTSQFKITAGTHGGTTRISVVNAKGESGSLGVIVIPKMIIKSPPPVVSATNAVDLIIDKACEATSIVAVPGGGVAFDPPSGTATNPLTTVHITTIKGASAGPVKITVRNDEGASADFNITVQ